MMNLYLLIFSCIQYLLLFVINLSHAICLSDYRNFDRKCCLQLKFSKKSQLKIFIFLLMVIIVHYGVGYQITNLTL
jgi:hypothetical protein